MVRTMRVYSGKISEQALICHKKKVFLPATSLWQELRALVVEVARVVDA